VETSWRSEGPLNVDETQFNTDQRKQRPPLSGHLNVRKGRCTSEACGATRPGTAISIALLNDRSPVSCRRSIPRLFAPLESGTPSGNIYGIPSSGSYSGTYYFHVMGQQYQAILAGRPRVIGS
jgi:hypothetical protein